MFPSNGKVRIPAALAIGVLAALPAVAACSGKKHQTGSVNLSVRPRGAVDRGVVVATVSGPALSASRTFRLSDRGDNRTWGAVIASLPVGRDYLFKVGIQGRALDALDDAGFASGITVASAQVAAVIITAGQAQVDLSVDNLAPVIDSLVLSSTTIAPGASIIAEATAHDPNADDTIVFAWSASPASDGFSAPSNATTQWTAPSTEGDQTLVLTVTDDHGAATSASLVVHVSANGDVGQADVEVSFNDWPIVTNLGANPGNLVPGLPTALVVDATDADDDALSFAWTSTCSRGAFSSTTTAATTFTLAAGATDTGCDFVVAVSDGRGGSTTGQTTLPVGNTVPIEAPAVTLSAQSTSVVDASGSVSFSVEASDPQGSPLTFQWLSPAGTLSNQVDATGTSRVVWTAPAGANGAFTVSAIVTDALGASKQFDFSVSTSGPLPVAVPVPQFAIWVLTGALALVGAFRVRRQGRGPCGRRN